VRTVEGTDDFASHREVLRRRFYRALEAEEGVAEELRWRLPDLVVIDGGLGQVNVAREVLDSLGLHDMPAIGLAKEREEIFLPASMTRSCCRPTRRRCTCSSACATRRTASRSPITASCAPNSRHGRCSTRSPA